MAQLHSSALLSSTLLSSALLRICRTNRICTCRSATVGSLAQSCCNHHKCSHANNLLHYNNNNNKNISKLKTKFEILVFFQTNTIYILGKTVRDRVQCRSRGRRVDRPEPATIGRFLGDPRNDLILAYFEFVEALKPRVFLMENVPGILWPRHRAYIEKFYAEGSRAGYHVFQPAILDARDFGVPQRRKRVFILGLRDECDKQDLVWPPLPTHCDLSLIHI